MFGPVDKLKQGKRVCWTCTIYLTMGLLSTVFDVIKEQQLLLSLFVFFGPPPPPPPLFGGQLYLHSNIGIQPNKI